MKLTEKTISAVKKESESAVNQMTEGKTAIEIAGEIYCKALPDKDAETGKVMAKRIDSIICEYEKNVKSALEDSDAWIKEQIDKQMEGREIEERCRILFSMLIGVSSLNDVLEGKKSAEEICREYSFDVSHVSEEYEDSLKEQLITAVQASAYGKYQLEELEKAIENGETEVSIADVINYGKHEHDVKVIVAMIAYVNAKNGSMEELPADTSLDEVAIAVAASYDAAATAEQVEEGKIPVDRGAKIIRAISAVASFMIAAVLTAATLLSVGFFIDMFLPRIIGVPLLIVAGTAIWGVFHGTAKECVEITKKIGAKVVKDGSAVIKKGAKKLQDFISENIAPRVSEAWNKVKAYIEKLKEDMEVSQEEEATVQA